MGPRARQGTKNSKAQSMRPNQRAGVALYEGTCVTAGSGRSWHRRGQLNDKSFVITTCG